uniref:NADH dehydrogenase [ubiquinone] iron-sulfur protein 5 n=1 Tax=Aotus nancymaae TaxID=37293 RepID=A0A2K5CVE2_AOTNA
MPFLDVQKKFGLNIDPWLTIQKWIECAHGIGSIGTEKERKIEYDDFIECLLRQKVMRHVSTIRKQRDELIKEGKYTPPPHYVGKGEPRP